MNKMRTLNLIARIGLFTLILSLGTLAALVIGETEGLALADLSGASVQAVATVAHGDVIYASMTGGPQPTGVYRSDDNGRTWQVVSPGPGVAADALADLRGDVVVVNIWASWCVECEKEAPLLEQAWRDYRDRGVWFIGVDYLDIDSEALAYISRFDITYPNGPDIGSQIYQDYRATGVPETFFIDREGIIRHVQIGPVTRSQLRGLLDQLLAEGS